MTEYIPWIAALACAGFTYKWWTSYIGEGNIYAVLALIAFAVFREYVQR